MDGEEVESVGEIRPSARYTYREMLLYVDGLMECAGRNLAREGSRLLKRVKPPSKPLLLDGERCDTYSCRRKRRILQVNAIALSYVTNMQWCVMIVCMYFIN